MNGNDISSPISAARGGFAFPTPRGLPPVLPILGIVALFALLYFSAPLVEAQPQRFFGGATAIGNALKNFAVWPDWAFVPQLMARLAETFEIAFLALGLSLILSLPLGLLAARNSTPHPIVAQVVRGLLVLVRAVPDILIALAFVAALGLGPLPGVVALAVATTGFMARFFSDAIEVADKKAVEGVAATGASAMHIRLYALLPQALPDLASTTFYTFDSNLRAATILGIVGAGGIGYDLQVSIGLFEYGRVLLIMLAIYLSVAFVDRLSTLFRARIA